MLVPWDNYLRKAQYCSSVKLYHPGGEKQPNKANQSFWSLCSVISHCPRSLCIEGMADCVWDLWEWVGIALEHALLRGFQVCSLWLSSFHQCEGWRGGSKALSGAGASPNVSSIFLMRLGVSLLGREGWSLQQLNAMKPAWFKMEGKLSEIERKKNVVSL